MSVEYASVRRLAQQFGTVPAELRRELRPRLRLAGERLRGDIRSRAATFSSRIPAAVRMSVAFGSKTGGVRVYVSHKAAPEARQLENQGQAGSFRHPVYGNRDVWVSQTAHPFFFPAVKANRERVRTLVEDAVRASVPKGTIT